MIQLEFNLDDLCPSDNRFADMQRQIDAAVDSMGKVRRRMFHELGAMKAIIEALKTDNEELQRKLKVLCDEKQEWSYQEQECLFRENRT